MKRCSTCKEVKAFSEFNKNKSRKDGLHNQCKVCKKEDYEANREKRLVTMKLWRDTNREEQLAQKKAYYEANREKKLAYDKAYYEANREKKLAYAKFYRETNRETLLAKARANPEKIRDKNHKRRARKRNLPVEDVKLSVLRERDGDTCYLCGRVINFDWPHKFPNGRLNPDYPHIDHVIPLSRGGSHTYDNTKLAHAICNLQKSDKILEEEDTQ